MAIYQRIELLVLDIGGVLMTINKAPIRIMLAKNGYADDNFFDNDFILFQMGQISSQDFIAKKSQLFQMAPDDIIQAFSNMLEVGDTTILNKIKRRYLFASNINELHFDHFRCLARPSLFALQYSNLSHQVGYLKPDMRFFAFLRRSFIRPSSMLFIDDKIENIMAAQRLGLKIAHCPTPQYLEQILKDFQVL